MPNIWKDEMKSIKQKCFPYKPNKKHLIVRAQQAGRVKYYTSEQIFLENLKRFSWPTGQERS